jgi:hypothetical protein
MGFEAVGIAGWSFTLLGVAVLILALFALVAVFRSGATIGMKLLWTILIVLLPLIGSVVYFLVNGTGGPPTDSLAHRGRSATEKRYQA